MRPDCTEAAVSIKTKAEREFKHFQQLAINLEYSISRELWDNAMHDLKMIRGKLSHLQSIMAEGLEL